MGDDGMGAGGEMDRARIEAAVAAHANPPGVRFEYGTAGFRTKAELLDGVMVRVGLLAALRALHFGQAVGVMITASHNPAPDNGVKIVDPTGAMLAEAWESYATELANLSSPSLVADRVLSLAASTSSSTRPPSATARVLVGRDTRASSASLFASLCDGIAALGVALVDLGTVTTPQVHSLTAGANGLGAFPVATEDAYFAQLADAFSSLVGLGGAASRGALIVDAANGIGGPKLASLSARISASLSITVVNATDAALLNDGCGADYVKTHQRAPLRGDLSPLSAAVRYASLDGDADRIVYYISDPSSGAFTLLDGDKIAALMALHLGDVMARAGLRDALRMGVVQTAYANGASTRFLASQGIANCFAKTGVKYLHAEAHARYDVGIYFEANGHGTVLFSDKAIAAIERAAANEEEEGKEGGEAARELLQFARLINHTVGDALSDLLVVEAILARRGMAASEWAAVYEDLPNVLAKVKVPDRAAFETTDAETRVVRPAGVQTAVDRAVGKVQSGRAFVRPSGTEDVVRVYAEAATQAEARALAEEIVEQVERICSAA